MVGQEHHHRDETEHADQGPEHLLPGAGIAVGDSRNQVEPVDQHQAETVEQCHDRKQERVGIGSEPPDGQMSAKKERQEAQGEEQQVPAQALLLIGLDDQQGHTGDQGGEAEQGQLGVAAVRQRRDH